MYLYRGTFGVLVWSFYLNSLHRRPKVSIFTTSYEKKMVRTSGELVLVKLGTDCFIVRMSKQSRQFAMRKWPPTLYMLFLLKIYRH